MSRGIGATNETAVAGDHVHEVTMAKIEFTTPVYVHSGVGSFAYDGNTYLGVGSFGNISPLRESQVLGPSAIELQLDATNSTYITEVLSSGNYGDAITIYHGYRDDDGALLADPWVAWKGYYEYGSISEGEQSIASITCQHDLAVLNERNGDRYSDEDQQDKFAADVGFEFVANTNGLRIIWGGGGVPTAPPNERDRPQFER